MGEEKHHNHIVPQFYLKQWCDINGQLHTYDFIHDIYDTDSTGSVGWIKDTYSDELENTLMCFEDIIAKVYPNIISKLETAPWKSVMKLQTSILSHDEEYLLMLFMWIQSLRTIQGRLRFLSDKQDHALDVYEAHDIAQQHNDELLNALHSVSKTTIYEFLKDKYWIVLRIPRHYSFWTSTNPVYYGSFKDMFCPIESLYQNYQYNDSQILTLSPRLKLCLVNVNHYYWKGIRPEHLYILQLDAFKAANPGWVKDKDKIMSALNFGIMQGYEMQPDMKKYKGNKFIHPLNSRYYIISNREFSDTDKQTFKYFGIEGVRNYE